MMAAGSSRAFARACEPSNFVLTRVLIRRYEWEYGVHECFLKEAHPTSSKKCHDYSSWEFEDTYWQGQSGPAVCGQWKNADA